MLQLTKLWVATRFLKNHQGAILADFASKKQHNQKFCMDIDKRNNWIT